MSLAGPKIRKTFSFCAKGTAIACAGALGVGSALFCADKAADGLMYVGKQIGDGLNRMIYPHRPY